MRALVSPELDQLSLELALLPPWRLARTVEASPHKKRILERLDFVRRFFPELDGTTIRVGLAKKPGVLGWGSLDPDHPGIWVRPRRCDRFTIAHELTHLLQARELVPGGERSCDLFALARSPLLIDSAPQYLRMPPCVRVATKLEPAWAHILHRMAKSALEARVLGRRDYLRGFERAIEIAFQDRA
ncbi:MAG TPA: hypothetical protein VKF80_05105 [Candidatus Eisenbacteria bacterium]|nr:hypothetical protein [Candidatus Eisenbacteria bacterium]